MTTDITELAQSLKAAAKNLKKIGIIHNYSRSVAAQIDFEKYANPDNVIALVEALEKAQQEADELSKFKEVMASAAEALKTGNPLNLESLFKGELASAMFSMMFAGEFVRSGSTNYLELLYEVPEFGEMTVTLQKVEGKTPGQRIAELESRTVKLPKPKNSDQGWKIDPEFINKVQDAIGYDDTCECWEGTPSMELVEAVLLAAAGIKVEAE